MVEQPHQATDIARAGVETPLLAFVGLGEQGADQLVEHLDGCVRQPGFEIDGLSSERGAAAKQAVVAQQESRRDRSLTRKLPEPVFMDAQRNLGIDLHFTDVGQPLDDLVEIAPPRCFWHVAQPGQRRSLQCGVVPQQRVEAGKLCRRQRRDQRFGGLFSGARSAGEADPFDHIRAWQDNPGLTNAMQHGTNDSSAFVSGGGSFRRLPYQCGQIAANGMAKAQ